MIYPRDDQRQSKGILTTLVIITISLVAYWAATGGLDQIGTGG